jgi:DNA-binding NarL/FixJ family response regulator
LIRVQQQVQEAAARLAVAATPAGPDRQDLLDKLSERELDVLRLTAQGQETAQIAEALFLSENTVRVYRSRLMQKLALDNMPALVKFALKHQLIPLE